MAPSGAISGADDAWLPLTTAAALLGVICSADASCLPLTTATPLFGEVGRTDGALPLTTTAPISDKASRDAAAWVLLSVCRAGGARVSVSAVVLLISGDCRDDGARGAPPAVMPTDGTSEPAVTGAWINAVDEFVASHANNATPQTPTAANTPTAMPAVRNLMGRRCRFCAARRGPDATASGFTA